MKKFLKILTPLVLVFVVVLGFSGCAKSMSYGLDVLYKANINYLKGESTTLSQSDFNDKQVKIISELSNFNSEYNGLLKTTISTVVERQGKYKNEAGNITYPKLHIKQVTTSQVYNSESKQVETKVTTNEYYFSNGEQYVYNTGLGYVKSSTTYSAFISAHKDEVDYLSNVQDDVFSTVDSNESYSVEDSVDKKGKEVTLERIAKIVNETECYDVRYKIVLKSEKYSRVENEMKVLQNNQTYSIIYQLVDYSYSVNIEVPQV